MAKLSHVDSDGKARMVDVSGKKETEREAVASGRVTMAAGTYALIRGGQGPKGDIFTVAKIAGIMAAKKTGDLIPMCHPLELTGIEILFSCDTAAGEVSIEATVQTIGRTGVEMEAMTAVSAAGLTIYDMCKAVDKAIVIDNLRLLEKSGGASGDYHAD